MPGLVLPAGGHGEEVPRWRLFGGGVHFRWQTEGGHGHLRECREPDCDDEDWRRGNLDNALGLRLGVERLWAPSQRVSFAAGGELDLLFSEYNLSQRDVLIGGAFATGGVGLGGQTGAVVVEVGIGGFASGDGRGGAAGFLEAGAEVVVSPASRMRLAARRSWLGSLTADEASLTLRASPSPPPAGNWRLGVGVGGSWPGLGGGQDAGLGDGAVWELEVARRVGRGGDRAGALVSAVGRESRFESVYGAVPGNQRGREVWEVGGWWDRRLFSRNLWDLRGGLVVRAADWSDQNPLLLHESGEVREGRLEVAIGGTLEAGYRIGDGLRLVAAVEPLVWPRLEFAELRARVGLSVGRDHQDLDGGGNATRCRGLLCDWGRDLGALAARPAHLQAGDWRALGLSVLAVGAIAMFDEPIRETLQRRSSPSSRDAAEAFRPVSFWGPLAGAATVWGVARLAGNERTEQAAADALETVLLTVLVVVPAIKEVSGRARPAAGLGASHLRPFSEHKSFPSGEVAQAFALAAVARQHRAAPWLQGVLWTFAGAAVWSRLELDRHWASDTVAGALVGVAMGRWLAGRASARRSNDGLVMSPVVVPGGVAVMARVGW